MATIVNDVRFIRAFRKDYPHLVRQSELLSNACDRSSRRITDPSFRFGCRTSDFREERAELAGSGHTGRTQLCSHSIQVSCQTHARILGSDDASADIDLRRAQRVLLDDLGLIEENHERFLIAFGAARNEIDIGDEVGRLRRHTGKFIFPYLVAAAPRGHTSKSCGYSFPPHWLNLVNNSIVSEASPNCD
jgi:hypothetical protein